MSKTIDEMFNDQTYEQLSREYELLYKIVTRMGEALQEKQKERLRRLREQPMEERDK